MLFRFKFLFNVFCTGLIILPLTYSLVSCNKNKDEKIGKKEAVQLINSLKDVNGILFYAFDSDDSSFLEKLGETKEEGTFKDLVDFLNNEMGTEIELGELINFITLGFQISYFSFYDFEENDPVWEKLYHKVEKLKKKAETIQINSKEIVINIFSNAPKFYEIYSAKKISEIIDLTETQSNIASAFNSLIDGKSISGVSDISNEITLSVLTSYLTNEEFREKISLSQDLINFASMYLKFVLSVYENFMFLTCLMILFKSGVEPWSIQTKIKDLGNNELSNELIQVGNEYGLTGIDEDSTFNNFFDSACGACETFHKTSSSKNLFNVVIKVDDILETKFYKNNVLSFLKNDATTYFSINPALDYPGRKIKDYACSYNELISAFKNIANINITDETTLSQLIGFNDNETLKSEVGSLDKWKNLYYSLLKFTNIGIITDIKKTMHSAYEAHKNNPLNSITYTNLDGGFSKFLNTIYKLEVNKITINPSTTFSTIISLFEEGGEIANLKYIHNHYIYSNIEETNYFKDLLPLLMNFFKDVYAAWNSGI